MERIIFIALLFTKCLQCLWFGGCCEGVEILVLMLSLCEQCRQLIHIILSISCCPFNLSPFSQCFISIGKSRSNRLCTSSRLTAVCFIYNYCELFSLVIIQFFVDKWETVQSGYDNTFLIVYGIFKNC